MTITILAQDTFTRANQPGWSPASDGESWSMPFGPSTLSIAGNKGVVSATTGANLMLLGTSKQTNFDEYVRFSSSNTASTIGLVMRYVDVCNYMRVDITNGLAHFFKESNCSGSFFPSSTAPGILANTTYRVHVNVSDNAYGMNVWLDGQSEPAGYQLIIYDSTFWNVGGQFGLYTFLATNSDTVSFDSFQITQLAQTVVSIAGSPVTFDEDTWQIHLKADERQRFQATILDYPGTARYSRSQRVSVTDPTLGTLFSGVLASDDLDKSNTYPDAAIEHQIDTIGNEYFVDKRTSSRLYTTPTYASKVVFDAVNDNLAAEGIIAPSAQSFVSTQSDWGTGTLSSVVATGNVGDGDLELANNGTVVSAAYLVQSDWSSGTTSNLVANSGGDLSLIGVTRNWDNGSTSGQTLYGGGSPSQGVTSGQYTLSCAANQATQSRLDFAGTWTNGTIDVDMVLANNADRHSLTWRTQHWNNTDDYAYTLEFWPNTIQMRVGQNGNGGTNTLLIAHNFSPALSAGTYRVRLVLNGSSFTASVNGTQYLTTSDSTYSTAGYISLRNRNTTSTTVTAAFDNFGIMQAQSGTWTSASASINSVSSIASSVITWDSSLSQGGTVLVQSSIDSGSTYQMCTSGSPIPGLTSGTSGTGKTVIIKITLSTTTSAAMPDLKTLQWSVVGGYSASGTRVSPALSLAPAGRVGSSVVAWNANLPSTATTLGVDVSLDNGTTWTDVSGNNGGPIPGLNGQPEPTVDGFAADTSANYITGIGYGGGMAAWTQDTAHSRIVATNGASSVYLNAAIGIANIDLFCDMDYSDAGGLAWCFIDAQNYYGLIVADNQASIGTKNRMTLYKTAGGVQSTLATGAITFQRGMWYRIRATNLDGVITAYFDGVQVLTYTDSSPLSAGQAGLYQAGGLATNYALRTLGPTLDLGITGGTPTMARFYQLWLQPMGDNVTGQNVVTRLRLATTDATLTPQVLDLTVGVYSNTIGVGALIPSADYRMQFQSKVLDDVAKQSNYAWWVDPNKVLNVRERSAVPAPWILQSTSLGLPVDLEADSNLKVTVANDLFRNRQNLTGVLNTGQFPGRSFQGDGQTTSFTLDYPIAPGTVPVITLNTVPQKVGKKGTTGSQYYYADNDPVIAQDSNLTKLISTDRLAVSFTGIFTTTVTVDNLASQAALTLKEGGTGIVEAVEDVSSRGMMYAAAVAYAQQLLVRYCIDGTTIVYTTYRNGLQPLQIQSGFLPEMGLFDTQMLITAIDVTLRTQPGNTMLYQYIVTATELPNQGSWQKLLSSALLLT